MFDQEFYPTPQAVIEKMIAPIKDIHKRFILEPSAGKGDILDILSKGSFINFEGTCVHLKGVNKRNMYCIEQNPDLSTILQGKGYRIVGNDFLQYTQQYCIDLVLMNPPFSNGDEHLLHAWETLSSGDIVCLLNAETILNPYTRTRELLCKVIDDHGTVEMLGNCFSNAQRKTDVNVALVRLHKAASKESLDLDFEPSQQEQHCDFTEEINTGNQVALDDKLGAYLRLYEESKQAAAEYIKARAKLSYFADAFLDSDTNVERLIKSAIDDGCNDNKAIYNHFIDDIKMKAWSSILSKLGIEKYMTNSVRKNFAQFKTTQGSMDLTRGNVNELILMICRNSNDILKQAVVDVFDTFTKYYEENRCHVEGWKTNSAWKVNKKVILPNYISMGYGSTYSTNHRYWNEFDDIDKAMCYLTGTDYDSLDKPSSIYETRPEEPDALKRLSLRKAISHVKHGDSGIHESTFFHFRCYKKGTLHITFKDEALWAKFNQVACDGKFALGGDFRKTA